MPDNCHTILVTNPSAAVVGLVGRGTAPVPLVAGVNAQRVPPGSTVTLSMGPIRDRGPIDEAQAAGSGIIFDATAALTLEVTFVNLIGGPG